MIARPTDFTDIVTYMKLLTIWHNQQNQDAENLKAHDDFAGAAKTWIVQAVSQLAHGLPVPDKPVLPQHKQYNDDGTITLTAFPDLAVPELPVPDAPGGGSGVSKNPPADRTDAILMLLGKICDKLGIK
jgi:hypothetical protein